MRYYFVRVTGIRLCLVSLKNSFRLPYAGQPRAHHELRVGVRCSGPNKRRSVVRSAGRPTNLGLVVSMTPFHASATVYHH